MFVRTAGPPKNLVFSLQPAPPILFDLAVAVAVVVAVAVAVAVAVIVIVTVNNRMK
jgi:hypothetical protein